MQTDPERWTAFDPAGEPRIVWVDPAGRPELVIPAEALLRLCYGRLDPAHTSVGIQGNSPHLDDLRTTPAWP